MQVLRFLIGIGSAGNGAVAGPGCRQTVALPAWQAGVADTNYGDWGGAHMHRVGIIPFDTQDDAFALLFITSQTRGRWILPKGRAKANETHSETCHREGFEEAGVRGIVLENYPFTVLITKQVERGVEQVPVTYYPYLVREQADKWPEHDQRQRHWALIEDASKVAYRDDILTVIRQFELFSPWIREFAEHHKS